MKILGIESSSLVASVALLHDDKILAEYTLNHKKTHSQTLLPMLDEIVRITDTKLDELDAIAISAGPGSFTGLRIGAATAKGMGMALDKPLLAISTLEATAYNFMHTGALICPIMDARRNQVYNALFKYEKEFLRLSEDRALDIYELIEELRAFASEVIFLGDGVPVYREIIEKEMKQKASFAPPHLSRQRAAALAALGAEYYQKRLFTSADEMRPFYLRKSQAEREKEERAAREEAPQKQGESLCG